MKVYHFFTAVLLLCLLSCETNEPPKEDVFDIEKLQQFLGTFEYSGSQNVGIVTHYDSSGNVIFQGFTDVELTSETIEISTYEEVQDSLTITGLITDFYPSSNFRRTVVGKVEEGRIEISFDESDLTRKEVLTGTLEFEGDRIFVNYSWDRSDIWSYEALPEKGELVGEGSRKM